MHMPQVRAHCVGMASGPVTDFPATRDIRCAPITTIAAAATTPRGTRACRSSRTMDSTDQAAEAKRGWLDRASLILGPIALVILALSGLWAINHFSSTFPRDTYSHDRGAVTSEPVKDVRALVGIIESVGVDTISIVVDPFSTSEGSSFAHRVVRFSDKTVIERRGTPKDAAVYAEESASFNHEMEMLSEDGSSSAAAQMAALVAPDSHAYERVTAKDLAIGMNVVVFTDTNIHLVSEFTAKTVRVMNTQ